jgi:hypothetical protein
MTAPVTKPWLLSPAAIPAATLSPATAAAATATATATAGGGGVCLLL